MREQLLKSSFAIPRSVSCTAQAHLTNVIFISEGAVSLPEEGWRTENELFVLTLGLSSWPFSEDGQHTGDLIFAHESILQTVSMATKTTVKIVIVLHLYHEVYKLSQHFTEGNMRKVSACFLFLHVCDLIEFRDDHAGMRIRGHQCRGVFENSLAWIYTTYCHSFYGHQMHGQQCS